jgi:hypothetical protein
MSLYHLPNRKIWPYTCKFLRRKFIAYENPETFKVIREEWVIEECGSRIYGDGRTVCDICYKGSSIEKNQPVDNEENKKMLIENAQYYKK